MNESPSNPAAVLSTTAAAAVVPDYYSGPTTDNYSTGFNCTTKFDNYSIGYNYTYYKIESTIILGFVSLPISIFGLIANLLSIRIFTHPIMKSSPINWYLAVLSTSDFFIIICSFFTHCLPRLSEFAEVFGGYRASLYMSPFTYPIATMAQTISVYMTILMSAHRFIGVCFPFRANEILQKGRVKIAIGALLTLAILFNLTRLFEVYTDGQCWAEEIQDWIVVMEVTELRKSRVYQWIFMGFGQTIIMFIIPFVSLIVLNSQIIRAVHRTRMQHLGMQTDDREKKAELAKEISTSVMLVGIVLVFLTCNSLAFVVNIIECAGLMATDKEPFTLFVSISNLLVNVNASINIAVYCLFSEKYRALLTHYASCHCLREGEVLLSSFN